MKKRTSGIKIAGVMTGTSCDGLDLAVMEFTTKSWIPLAERTLPFPKKLKEAVQAIQATGSRWTLQEVFSLHRDLGRWYAEGISKLISDLPKNQKPDVIALHGQTVGHFPNDKNGGFTIQLGEPSWIAEKTGLTVISNFREGDLSVGGQGAPLVPRYHSLLGMAVPEAKDDVVFLNIGGISNYTYIGKKGEILASDTGLGNLWIDAVVKNGTKGKAEFDRDGEVAFSGEVDLVLLEKWLRLPYFKKPAPKSTGRDDFSIEKMLSEVKKLSFRDQVSTVTAFTIETIAQGLEKDLITKKKKISSIILCGGGSKNEAIVESLMARLFPIPVMQLDELGFDSQYIEAQAFSYLAFRTLLGAPLSGPWTGAEKAGPAGRIIPGKNWADLLKILTRNFSKN